MAKWSAQHYNALAKEIRELFPMGLSDWTEISLLTAQRAILTTLALNLAVRFSKDNEQFDPLRFLDACSPDPDVYPLSELWEDRP